MPARACASARQRVCAPPWAAALCKSNVDRLQSPGLWLCPSAFSARSVVQQVGPPGHDTTADDHDIQQAASRRLPSAPPAPRAGLSRASGRTNSKEPRVLRPSAASGARTEPSHAKRMRKRRSAPPSRHQSTRSPARRNDKRRQGGLTAPCRRLRAPKPAIRPDMNATAR